MSRRTRHALVLVVLAGCSLPARGEPAGDDESGDEDSTGTDDGGDVPVCHNGIEEEGEECDDGNDNDADACVGECELATCGDNYLWAGEESCDSGLQNGLDGECGPTCEPEPECGNGIPEGDEGCDVGPNGDDTCTGPDDPLPCTTTACANGMLEPEEGEECLPDGPYADSCAGDCKWRDGYLAVAAGVSHTCAILHSGEVKCWGRDTNGQLGYPGVDTLNKRPDELPTIDFGVDERVIQLALGHQHSCALFAGGDVRCWGDTNKGVVGKDQTRVPSDPPLNSEFPFKDIRSGTNHVCGILDEVGATDSNALACWGSGSEHKTGRDWSDDVFESDPAEIFADLDHLGFGDVALTDGLFLGEGHSCTHVLSNDEVVCWGANHHDAKSANPVRDDFGLLGYGSEYDDLCDPADSDTWCQYNPGCDPDGENSCPPPHESEDTVPEQHVPLGTFASLRLGGSRYTTCAATGEGGSQRLRCWGSNERGALGIDQETTAISSPDDGELDVFPGWQIKSFARGFGNYTVFVLVEDEDKNPKVWCWGKNDVAQCGRDIADTVLAEDWGKLDIYDSVVSLAAGSSHACLVVDDGNLYCWGKTTDARLGYGEDLLDIGFRTFEQSSPVPF